MRLMLAVDVWGLGAIRMGVHGVAFSDGRAPLGDRLLLLPDFVATGSLDLDRSVRLIQVVNVWGLVRSKWVSTG